MSVRELRFLHGSAWLAPVRQALPEHRREGESIRSVQCARWPAWMPGRGAVSVRLMQQNASGGSYFAMVGVALRPGAMGTLEARLPLLASPDGAVVVRALREGLARSSTLPAGELEIWVRTHPVDFKPWAFSRAVAVAARLLCQDVDHLDEEALRALAEEPLGPG